MRGRIAHAAAAVLATAVAATTTPATVIAPGHLVILQTTGDQDLAERTAVPVTLVEYAAQPNSAAVQTLNVPTTGDARLTLGAQSTTEGLLTYNDGYIGIAGYDSDPGTPLVFNGTTNAPRRMIAYDTKQDLASGPQYNATTTIFNNGNFRSAIYSATAGGAYGIGALAGIVFQPNGGSGTGTNVVGTGAAALQGIGIFGGNLYSYKSSGSGRGVYEITGLPTTAGNESRSFVLTPQTENNNTGIVGYNFWISPDQSTVYLAEDTDTASAANGGLPTGGIKKYVKGGDGNFSLAYTISTDYDGDGPGLTGVRSISVDNSGATPLIYATTADRQKVISLSDTGNAADAAATLSVLQSAAAGTVIRSVAFIPHLPGDADDSGVLDGSDYTLVDRGYARYLDGTIPAGQAVWADGDFNRDGAVNAVDYFVLDTGYGAAHPLAAALLDLRQTQFGREYVAALTAAVPEPATTSALAVALTSLATRRRRRRLA